MKRKISEIFLYTSFLALVIIILWIYLGISKTITNKENLAVSKQEITELNPKLDEGVFEELKKRTQLPE